MRMTTKMMIKTMRRKRMTSEWTTFKATRQLWCCGRDAIEWRSAAGSCQLIGASELFGYRPIFTALATPDASGESTGS